MSRGSLAVQALIQVQPALDFSSAVNVLPSCMQIDAATGEEQEVVSYNDKVGAVWTSSLQSQKSVNLSNTGYLRTVQAELTTLLQVDVGRVMMSENTRYTAGHDSFAAIRKRWLLSLTWALRMLLSCASSLLLLAGSMRCCHASFCMSLRHPRRGTVLFPYCCPCALLLMCPASAHLTASDCC